MQRPSQYGCTVTTAVVYGQLLIVSSNVILIEAKGTVGDARGEGAGAAQVVIAVVLFILKS